MNEELRNDDIARRLELLEEVFSGQSLSAVLAASPVETGSMDLFDLFAGAIVDQGVDEEQRRWSTDEREAGVTAAEAAWRKRWR